MSKEQIMQQNISDERLAELVRIYEGTTEGHALTELQARRAAERWIPIGEGLPEPGVKLLVTTAGGFVEIDSVNKHDLRWEWDDDWTVTHFRALPTPAPQEER